MASFLRVSLSHNIRTWLKEKNRESLTSGLQMKKYKLRRSKGNLPENIGLRDPQSAVHESVDTLGVLLGPHPLSRMPLGYH